jgi:hypothetical protein
MNIEDADSGTERGELFLFMKAFGAILLILFGTALLISIAAIVVYLFVFVFGKMSVLVLLLVFMVSGFAFAVWLLFRLAKFERRRRAVAEHAEPNTIELEIDPEP